MDKIDLLQEIEKLRTRLAELEVQQGRTTYCEALFDKLDAGVAFQQIIYDESGKPVDYLILDINPACAAFLKMERSEVIGRRATEVAGTDTAPYLEILAQVAATGSTASFEAYTPRLGGYFSVSIFPISEGQVATVFRDITRQRKMLDALRASEKHYRQSIEHSPNVIFSVNREGAILGANRAFWKELGYGRGIVGQHYRQLLAELADVPVVAAGVEEVFEGKTKGGLDITYRCRDGTLRYMNSRLYPLFNTSGEVDECVFANTDITERKQAEQKLRASEERYRRLLNSITDICYVIDKDWHYTHINQAASRATRRNEAELLGKRITDVMPGIEATPQFEAYRRAMESRTPHRFTADTLFPDGMPGEFEVMVYPIEEGILCIAHDISDRVRAEKAEREQRALVEALRDAASAINNSLDLDEVLSRILHNVGRVVAHDGSTIMLVKDGVACAEVKHRQVGPRVEAAHSTLSLPVDETPNLRYMVQTRKPLIIPDVQHYPGWVEWPDERWLRSYVGAPIYQGEELLGFLSLGSKEPNFFTPDHAGRLQAFADQAAIAIRNARLYETARSHAAELEARNRELDAFSHNVAHNLKSPLQVIMGYANLIRSEYADQISPEVANLLLNIELYADKMDQIVRSLLLFARLRDVQEVLRETRVKPIVQSVLYRFERDIQARSITVEVAADLPSAMAYGPWLEEVFANLIGNAIKYIGRSNPDPRIWVRGYRQPETGKVRYEVQDNGIGITPENQTLLFKRFTRLQTDKADKIEGYGLGLSIVQRIIEKLNGQVGVESTPGQGSTFWFTLDAPPQTPADSSS